MFKKIILFLIVVLIVLIVEAAVVGLPQSMLCSGRRWLNLKLPFNLVPDFGCVAKSRVINNTAWDNVVAAIQACRVESAMQTHKRQVTVTLKDGYRLTAIEPNIDDIMDVIAGVNQKCGDFPVATE